MRPAISGEILADDASWKKIEFLVDTAADRTVFSTATLAKLSLQPVDADLLLLPALPLVKMIAAIASES